MSGPHPDRDRARTRRHAGDARPDDHRVWRTGECECAGLL